MKYLRNILIGFLMLVVSQLPNFAQVAYATDLNTNLIHYYKFDESSGNAADSKGSATLTNNNSTAYAAAKINNGAHTVAANINYLNNTSDINGGTNLTAYTLGCWISVDSAPADNTKRHFFMEADGDGELEASYAQTGLTLNLRFVQYNNVESATVATYNTTLTVGTLYYVVYRWDGNNISQSLNGSNVGTPQSITTIYTANSSGFAFGANAVNAASPWDGYIDECGFWSRALTDAEVTQLYNSGNGKAYPFSSASVPIRKANVINFE